jgi:hypothetical protein
MKIVKASSKTGGACALRSLLLSLLVAVVIVSAVLG